MGIESRLAAKAALDAAGSEYADATITSLCLVAKFDWESTSTQRAVWRRYGWSIPARFARAGYSQSAAAEFLRGERKTAREVVEYIRPRNGVGAIGKAFDDRCAQWVQRANKLMMDGAELFAESETMTNVASQAEMALMIYQRLAERHMDAEIRRFFETETVR